MIFGKRVRLRAVTREDIPRFVEWLNDPEVIEGLVIYLPFSMEDETRWFDGLASRPPEERPLAIDIRAGEDWTHIGSCGFHEFNWRHRSAEIGIAIGNKEFWNQGFGTETVRLMLRHGFDTFNLNRVFLRVYEMNRRAVRSYEKAGLTLEGRLRQARYHNGKYYDELIMGILRSEWDAAGKED